MPTWSDVTADSGENFQSEINKRLSWITSRLDSKNVKRLDTNETVIRSADGETQIVGPILKMYDKQATPKLRLNQGYDSGSGNFVFELYNKAGAKTVGIDSNGDATYNGSITIGTGDNVFKADSNGIYLGDSVYADAPFKVSMAGAATATNLTITGGSISVSTDITVGNKITLGDQTATNKEITFYNNGTNTTTMTLDTDNLFDITSWGEINIGGQQLDLVSNTDIFMIAGSGTGVIYINGEVAASQTWVEAQNTSSVSDHNHGILNGLNLATTDAFGVVNGYVTWVESGGHSHITAY